MNRQSVRNRKCLLWACLPFLLLSINTPATAATDAGASPKPGSYCPGTDVLLIVAEDISASLDLAMRSRAALINNDSSMAISELNSAGTTLRLAASRGAAARTILLIDAIIQAKAGENYAQMLTWFPLMHTSLLTLSDDATESAADGMIGRAKAIMQGDKEGDPMEFLKQARHMLACDGLDIPLQAAIAAQGALMKQLSQGNPVKNNVYDGFLDALRNTLLYTLGNPEN